MITHRCTGCGKVVATEDVEGIKPALGATLKETPNQAPRLRCGCGKVTILTKGAVT